MIERRWLRLLVAYHVWMLFRAYMIVLIFIAENGGLWGAYFKIMRNPTVQRHWAEFVYGDMNYGYGETVHWTDEGELPAMEETA